MKDLFRILKYIKPYWIYIVLNLISNFLFSIFSLLSLVMVGPFLQVLFEQSKKVLSKPILDFSKMSSIQDYFYYHLGEIIEHYGKYNALIAVSSLVIVLSLLSNLFRYLGMYFLSPLRNGVIKDLRNQIFNKLLILPLSFYSKMKSGDILSRISSDVSEVEWSIMNTMQLLFREPLMIIIYLITLFSISLKLTLFSFILLPVSGLLISYFGKKIKHKSEGSQQQLGEITSIFDESISGLRIIKGFNAIDIASNKFSHQNKKYTLTLNKLFRYSELSGPMSETLGISTLVILVFVGGMLVLNGSQNITADILISYVLLFARIISPAQSFISASYSIQKGIASGKRIFEILDSDEKIIETPNAKSISQLNNSIEFRNVSFKYDNELILNNFNLKVNKNQTIAIVGPSGAGKSTLIDLLPRFYDVSAGEILFDNVNIKNLKISDLRQMMGIVNQDVILFNDSIFNNIAFGQKNISEHQVIEASKNANAHQFIKDFPDGYNTIIGDRGSRLSGGQKQRISIARALLVKPQILIFDEATSSLDTESESIVQQAIDTLLENRTTFIIAHRLSTIRKADIIVVLEKGKIVEQGTHQNLINLNGKYKNMIDLQNFK